MVFKVLYIDPSAAGAAASLSDIIPPQIDSVRANPGAGALSTQITVEARDESAGGVAQVEGIYTDDQDNWIFVQFQKTSADTWSATVPVPPTSTGFIISARDAAGNVTVFNSKGQYGVAVDSLVVYVPIVRH